MSIRARVMTWGTPAPINTPPTVRVMEPTFFKTFVAGGTIRFSRLQLDISTSSDADLKILGDIAFDKLKIQMLVIVHYFNDTHPTSIANVWRCTQSILTKLTKHTGLTSLIIREPFPIEMLRYRAKYRDIITDLRCTLTTLDAHLCALINESPTSFTVNRPQGEHPYVDAESPRVYEFFPALRACDFIRVD